MRTTTRFLLSLLMATLPGVPGMGQTTLTHTADGVEVPSREKPLHPKTDNQEPAKHAAKVEVRKSGEPAGKPLVKAPEKGHAPQPVAVAPAATPPQAQAAPETPVAEAGDPAQKVPRFAALKTDETNLRKGPGQRYPIDWVYKRRDLPMEVERQYDVWRYVRDSDGVVGWVHEVTLSERRTFIVKAKDATLRSRADETASAVALLKAGVIGRLRTCNRGADWCEVQVGGYKGYLRRDQIWGLLPDEVVGPS